MPDFRQDREKGELVIGLDSSTTGTKALAVDRYGAVAARAFESVPLHSPEPNRYEQDPGEWWNSARKVLKSLVDQVDPLRIKALAISSQRETFVSLAKDGKVLRPAIVWLDERCKDEVDAFSAKVGKSVIHRITGKPPDYAPVVYRLAWMKRHEPVFFRQIGMICDVQSYLVRNFTSRWMTSWASADPLGLFDVKKRVWASAVLNALGLTENQLPAVCRPGTILGKITEEASELTGLNEQTHIVAGGGDGQAAGLGANVLTSKRAYLNLGTAVVAGIFGSHYRTSRTFRTMCSCSERGYYYECSLRAGTFALDWFIRKVLNVDPMQQPEIYHDLEREAEQVPPGCNGLLHLPYLCGVMNPFWDMDARGAFIGLSSAHHRGHIYRSILEGIAFEQLSAVTSVEKVIDSKVKEFVAIGGGATSELWLRIFADITGKKICVPSTTEASALGAAIAAAVGIGWYPTFRDATNVMTWMERTIAPKKENRRTYQRLTAVYTDIYPNLKKIGIDHTGLNKKLKR